MRKSNIDCKLAPSTLRSNRSNVFAKLKDEPPLTCIKFAVLIVKCTKCIFTEVLKTESLDAQRTINHHFNRADSAISEHLARFRSHDIPRTPKRLFVLDSRYEVNLLHNRMLRERRVL